MNGSSASGTPACSSEARTAAPATAKVFSSATTSAGWPGNRSANMLPVRCTAPGPRAIALVSSAVVRAWSSRADIDRCPSERVVSWVRLAGQRCWVPGRCRGPSTVGWSVDRTPGTVRGARLLVAGPPLRLVPGAVVAHHVTGIEDPRRSPHCGPVRGGDDLLPRPVGVAGLLAPGPPGRLPDRPRVRHGVPGGVGGRTVPAGDRVEVRRHRHERVVGMSGPRLQRQDRALAAVVGLGAQVVEPVTEGLEAD